MERRTVLCGVAHKGPTELVHCKMISFDLILNQQSRDNTKLSYVRQGSAKWMESLAGDATGYLQFVFVDPQICTSSNSSSSPIDRHRVSSSYSCHRYQQSQTGT